MNLKNLLSKIGFALTILVFLANSAFAQTYVSVTNGDDTNGDGSQVQPYKTIAKGITETSAGGTVVVEPGVYGEAVNVAKALTMRAEDFGSTGAPEVQTTSLTVNMTTGTDVLSFGESGLPFQLDGLTLTSGVLNVSTANVEITTGSTITRTNGSMNNSPTTTNVNVTYNAPTADITAGPELPADIGSGTLTIAVGAARAITVPNAVTTSGGVTITSGDATFSSSVTLEDATLVNDGAGDVTLGSLTVELDAALASSVDNNGNGNLTVGGTLTIAHGGTGAAHHNTDLDNNGTGTFTVSNAIVRTSADVGGTDYTPTVDILNVSTGDFVLNGGSVVTITNGAGGTVDIQANLTVTGTGANVIDNTNAASVIQLNSNTLTLNGAAPQIDNNGGDIISTTAGTAGSGKILADDGDVSILNGGEVPNLETTGDGEITIGAATAIWGNVVNAGTFDVDGDPTVNGNFTNTGDVDLAADLDVKGNYTQNTGGTFDFNAQTFTIEGNWFRDSNVLNDVTPATGTLSFTGDADAIFTPGAQLTLYNVTLNKDADVDKVTLGASLIVQNDINITRGTLEIGDFNIRLNTATGTFTNNSGGYQTNGTGFVIVEHAGATTFTGTGTFSNLDIRGGATVNLSSDINFSGVLNVRNGVLDLNDGAADGNDYDITLEDDVRTVPEINIYTDNGDLIDQSATPTGTVAVGTNVVYDLNYFETTDDVNAEWIAAGIRNLGILITGANTITQPLATSISGKLTVNGTATLDLNNNDLTLAGDGIAHSVLGTVLDGNVGDDNELVVTGDGSSVTGSTDDANVRTIEHMQVSIASGESFSMSNIENLDNLVVDDGTVSVSLINDPTNDNDGQFTGNLTVSDGSFTLTIAGDADDASAEEVAGNVLIDNDGSFTLGSDTQVGGTFDLGAAGTDKAAVDLGSNDLTLTGVFTHVGTGGITGSGSVVIDYTVNGNFVLTNDLSITNLEVANGAVTTTVTAGDLTVSNSYTHTSGTLDINGNNLVFSGSTFHYTAGTLTDGAGTGLIEFTGGNVAWGLEGDLTLVDLEFDLTSSTITISDQDGNSTADADKVIVTDDFTQTNGNVTLVDNISFELQDDFTRVAGSWTMGDGSLILNGIGTIDHGTGFAVDNLEVTGSTADFPDEQPWTVNKSLILAASLDPGDDNTGGNGGPQLTVANGVTIERQANAATLADEATYSGSVNLSYTTAGPITTSDEASATTINDVTVEVEVDLDRDLGPINGTLTLEALLDDDQGANDYDVDMAANSTVVLVDLVGTSLTDDPLVPAGVLNVTYMNSTGAGINSTDNELDKDFSLGTVTVDGAIAADEINLHDDLTVTTLVVNDDGPLDLNGQDLTVTNATLSSTGFVIASTAGDLIFGGATDGTLSLGSDWTVPSNVDVVLNKTNDSSTVTLDGADLDFANNDLVLTKGVFETDATDAIILTQSNTAGQPTQGFSRTSGVIAGNVKKFIDNGSGASIDRSTVIFPAGTNDGEYRPATFFFKTAPQSSINLVVNHDTKSPGGENGLPLETGSVTITNYPDFFWFIDSDITLAPSYKFDVELQAEGYSDYLTDGIQNVRMIRRDSGNVENQWRLQGSDSNYDNSTIALNHPLVKVIDATGGITSQGALFTYSQINKPPVFDVVADQTINEGDTLSLTYSATDPDVGQTATLASVSLPSGSTFDTETGKFVWATTYADSGSHQIILSATDGTETTLDTTGVTVVNVNRAPQFTAALPDTQSVAENAEFEFDFNASDPDADNVAFIFGIVDGPSGATIGDSSGVFKWTPAFGLAGTFDSLTVRVYDTDSLAFTDTTSVLKITKTNRAPSIARVSTGDTLTIAEGQMGSFTYTASDPDGDVLTYSVVTVAGDSSTGATMQDSVFTWTPGFDQAGEYSFDVKVTDNGAPNLSASDTLVVVVTNVNAAPVFTVEVPKDTVFVGETAEITYVASDEDNDALTFGFYDESPDGSTLTASGDSVVFKWTPVADETAIFIIPIYVEDAAGAKDSTETRLLVVATEVDVSGSVAYNKSGTAIEGAVAKLMSGETVVSTDTTSSAGAYSFADVGSGNYTVMVSKVGDVAGLSAADALLTAKYVVGSDTTLDNLQKKAADVTGEGNVTNADALTILNRVVGKITSFTAGDWYFAASSPVTVGGSENVVVPAISGIVYGDVNNSNLPAASLAKAIAAVDYAVEEDILISEGAEVNVPVKVEGLGNVSAITLELSYPQEKLEFLGINGLSGLVANVVDGKIRIAWADLSLERPLEAKELLAQLKFAATEVFGKDEVAKIEFVFAELADADGKPVAGNVTSANVSTALPAEFALSQNYPNPFNPSTKVQYALPQAGKVNFIIYNTLGEEVTRLVNNTTQAAGYYEVDFNASQFASGVYIYRITVEGVNNFVQTKKMLLIK